MSQKEDCPLSKRFRSDEGTNGLASNQEILKESLKEFHVLDEVEGDENMLDDEGNLILLYNVYFVTISF